MKVAGSLKRAVEVARQVGRDVMSCLECRTISYVDFVTELERMVDLAGYLGLGVGRHHTPLSALHVQFSAHFLNSAGVCTERVKEKLVRADGGDTSLGSPRHRRWTRVWLATISSMSRRSQHLLLCCLCSSASGVSASYNWRGRRTAAGGGYSYG